MILDDNDVFISALEERREADKKFIERVTSTHRIARLVLVAICIGCCASLVFVTIKTIVER
jgi:hypothetical protein